MEREVLAVAAAGEQLEAQQVEPELLGKDLMAQMEPGTPQVAAEAELLLLAQVELFQMAGPEQVLRSLDLR